MSTDAGLRSDRKTSDHRNETAAGYDIQTVLFCSGKSRD